MLPDDVDEIVALAIAAWEPIYDALRVDLGDDLFEPAHADWRASKDYELRTVCEAENVGKVLVATRRHDVIGFVSYFVRSNGLGVIGNNAVRPDC